MGDRTDNHQLPPSRKQRRYEEGELPLKFRDKVSKTMFLLSRFRKTECTGTTYSRRHSTRSEGDEGRRHLRVKIGPRETMVPGRTLLDGRTKSEYGRDDSQRRPISCRRTRGLLWPRWQTEDGKEKRGIKKYTSRCLTFLNFLPYPTLQRGTRRVWTTTVREECDIPDEGIQWLNSLEKSVRKHREGDEERPPLPTKEVKVRSLTVETVGPVTAIICGLSPSPLH